jgi:hypothetical protein
MGLVVKIKLFEEGKCSIGARYMTQLHDKSPCVAAGPGNVHALAARTMQVFRRSQIYKYRLVCHSSTRTSRLLSVYDTLSKTKKLC